MKHISRAALLQLLADRRGKDGVPSRREGWGWWLDALLRDEVIRLDKTTVFNLLRACPDLRKEDLE